LIRPDPPGSFPAVDGQRLGRIVLTTDAAYCAVAALGVLVFAGPLSGALAVPITVVMLAALGTAAWAVCLRVFARRAVVRPWLVRVLVANVLAASAIVALVATRPLDGLSILLAAVAVEVAGFAVCQALVLRRQV
jgi:hypothetical protein